MHGIGTLNEKPLHAALKTHYAGPDAQLEHKIGRYVTDIYENGHITEIQTANFSSISKKLHALLKSYTLTLVFPIAVEKWLIKLPSDDGEKTIRRKSPKRQDQTALFLELVRIPQLLSHPGFSIEVVLTKEEEVRFFDGNRGWRKKGWVTAERRLVEIVDQIRIHDAHALLSLLPASLPARFLTSDLAEKMGHPRWMAQKIAYCLRESGVIHPVGKKGNAIRYAPAC